MTKEQLKRAVQLHEDKTELESRISALQNDPHVATIAIEIQKQDMQKQITELLLRDLRKHLAEVNKAIEQL